MTQSRTARAPRRGRAVAWDANAGVPVLTWREDERLAEARGAMWWMGAAILLAVLNLLVALATQHPPIRYLLPDGRVVPGSAIHRGAVRGGWAPAALDSARAVGTALAIERFTLAPGRVDTVFHRLLARATTDGRAKLLAHAPRAAIHALIVRDSGVLRPQPYGAGPWATGLDKDRVRVVVPLVAVLHTRHLPFAGVRSGLRLGDTVEVTLRRASWAPGGFALDDISGELLPARLAEAWERYGILSTPASQVVINGRVIGRDSAAVEAYRRGAVYREWR